MNIHNFQQILMYFYYTLLKNKRHLTIFEIYIFNNLKFELSS